MELWQTLIAALILATALVFGGRRRIWARQSWVSAGAGVSIAYVFTDLLPLMSERQAAFAEAVAGRGLPAAELRVYVSALIGFIVFYGLESVIAVSYTEEDASSERRRDEPDGYRLQIGVFAIYTAMIGYLLVEWDRGWRSLILYTIALTFHFTVIDASLRAEHGERYDRSGRWILATGVVAGYLVGVVTPLSEPVLATVVGLVSGGIIVNSIKDELPNAGRERLIPFAVSALIYGMLVLLI